MPSGSLNGSSPTTGESPAPRRTARLGEQDLWRRTRRQIAPRRRMTPLEFGQKHRVYSKEGRSARWRVEETPWAAEILETLSDESPYQRVIAPKGTQLGFTELGLIWIGQGIVEAQSALVIEPTEATAKKVVRQKFRPMLLTTSLLQEVFTGRSADSTLHFSAPSVDVMFAGSNSPSNFASVTVPRFFGDEIDRWSAELIDEGDPLDLAANRIAEYGFLGKMFLPCSPTLEGVSLVWKAWLESDQRVFECPCPACGLKQQWLWDHMAWDADAPETVRLFCVGCGVGSTEGEWKSGWGAGAWRATNPAPMRKDTAGFHLSTLYSRLGGRSWAALAQQYIAAKASGLASRMQVFWNTILGLPWKVSEDAPKADDLRRRLEAEHERGVIPAGGLCLTAGIDYQKNRIEVFVWAWGRRRERWLVDKVVIERLTAEGKDRPSAELAADLKDQVLEKDWPHALGGSLRLEQAVHDANDRPADVFDVLDHLPKARNLASHGVEGWAQQLPFAPPKVVDVKRDGKVVKTGRMRMRLHTAVAKSLWYEDLAKPLSEEGGSERYVHLPAWIDEEEGLLEQFVAEEIRRTTRGKPYWHKVNARNEGLDCAVMGDAARWHLKTHRWSEAEWLRREAAVRIEQKSSAPPPPPTGGGRRSRVRGRIG
jgi:phage terminase large subunit GpA-like protein